MALPQIFPAIRNGRAEAFCAIHVIIVSTPWHTLGGEERILAMN